MPVARRSLSRRTIVPMILNQRISISARACAPSMIDRSTVWPSSEPLEPIVIDSSPGSCRMIGALLQAKHSASSLSVAPSTAASATVTPMPSNARTDDRIGRLSRRQRRAEAERNIESLRNSRSFDESPPIVRRAHTSLDGTKSARRLSHSAGPISPNRSHLLNRLKSSFQGPQMSEIVDDLMAVSLSDARVRVPSKCPLHCVVRSAADSLLIPLLVGM